MILTKINQTAGIPLEKISGAKVSVHTELNVVNDKDVTISDGISAILNLSGPSVTLDTNHSSSLVALDTACQAIQQGKSTMVSHKPYPHSMLYRSALLTPTFLGHRCRLQPYPRSRTPSQPSC
jgi:hypothetical protein